MMRYGIRLFTLMLVLVAATASASAQTTRPRDLLGVIESIDGGTIVFAGGQVHVDVLNADFAEGTSLDDLRAGDRVQVLLEEGEPLRAEYVRRFVLPHFETNASLDAVDPFARTVTVLGVLMHVTDSSLLIRPNVKQSTLTEFSTGERVYVAAMRTAEGLVVSRLAYDPPVPATPYRPEVTIEGTITAKDGYNWTVGGKRVLVTPRTILSGRPKVGDRVRVTGMPGKNEILAFTVKKL